MKLKIFLLLIVILGFALRIWQVDKIPAILNRDEAALAYNALLLKETGKDEWARTWPLALESFGDYKLPGYPVLLIGSFSLFGYNDIAVKLPSVVAGTVLIVLTYLFARDVLKLEEKYSVLAALFISIQPVFFFYSRIAFEANVALTLVIAALYFLFKSTTQRKRFDIVGILFFFGAVLTYNTPLLLLPFFILLLVWWRGWKQSKKWILPVIGLVLVAAFGFFSLFSLAKQKSGITIFSDETVWKQSVDYRLQFHGPLQKILGNKAVFFGQIIANNYLKTFLPHFVVMHGGTHPWHTLPGFGHLSWTVYVLGIIGIILSIGGLFSYARNYGRYKVRLAFAKSAKQKKKITQELYSTSLPTSLHHLVLLVFCLVITPLPAAVTVDAPHATRSLLLFWTFTLLASVAAQWIEALLVQRKWKWSSAVAVICVIAVSAEFGNYASHYFTEYQQKSFELLHGGFQQTIKEVDDSYNHKKVAIIDPDGYQYILTAWYLKMPASTYFSTVQKHLPDKIGFRYGYKLGKYRFIVSEKDKFLDEDWVIEWVNNSWLRVD
jgi:4-amino-4-deoxy-L-arabinose transferase-like glycosyltransferase